MYYHILLNILNLFFKKVENSLAFLKMYCNILWDILYIFIEEKGVKIVSPF